VPRSRFHPDESAKAGDVEEGEWDRLGFHTDPPWEEGALGPGLEALANGLKEARKIYEATCNDYGGRQGAARALQAVRDFVGFVHFDAHAALPPLRELIDALKELDRGRIPAILQKVPVAVRPRSSAWEEIRDDAAAAAELLHRSGLKLPRACKRVADQLERAGLRLPGRDPSITGRTVRAWRRDLYNRGYGTSRHADLLSSDSPENPIVTLIASGLAPPIVLDELARLARDLDPTLDPLSTHVWNALQVLQRLETASRSAKNVDKPPS
jgi:hypothetical protein